LVFRAVFFDFGGTLLVMRRDRIFQRVLGEEGYEFDLDRIHSAYMAVEPAWLATYGYATMSPEETDEAYRHLDQMIFSNLSPDAGEPEAARVSRQVRQRWPELDIDIPPALYPDVRPSLERLRNRGLTLGIISNAPASTVDTISAVGLNGLVDHIIVSGIVGYSKPNPEIFRIALLRAAVRADEAAHVGDIYESDVVGANNAGMKGILLDRHNAASFDCPTIATLDELDPLLWDSPGQR